MFAVVRTGGKQYRVAAGDKIAVEKLAGEAGDTITLGDVLLAGEGDKLADAAKVTVSAEIIAQAKSEKVDRLQEAPSPQLSPQERPSPADDAPAHHCVGDAKAEKKAAPKKEAAPKAEDAEEARHEGRSKKDESEAKAAPGQEGCAEEGRAPRKHRPRRPLPRRPARSPKTSRSRRRWHIKKQAVRRATVAIRPVVASA